MSLWDCFYYRMFISSFVYALYIIQMADLVYFRVWRWFLKLFQQSEYVTHCVFTTPCVIGWQEIMVVIILCAYRNASSTTMFHNVQYIYSYWLFVNDYTEWSALRETIVRCNLTLQLINEWMNNKTLCNLCHDVIPLLPQRQQQYGVAVSDTATSRKQACLLVGLIGPNWLKPTTTRDRVVTLFFSVTSSSPAYRPIISIYRILWLWRHYLHLDNTKCMN